MQAPVMVLSKFISMVLYSRMGITGFEFHQMQTQRETLEEVLKSIIFNQLKYAILNIHYFNTYLSHYNRLFRILFAPLLVQDLC